MYYYKDSLHVFPFSIVYYFLSFVVAQICPPSQKYLPTAPMTDLSTHSPPSTSTTFNYDTPPPTYDEVRNQAGRGSEPSKHVPHHSTGKFDQLKYLLPFVVRFYVLLISFVNYYN